MIKLTEDEITFLEKIDKERKQHAEAWTEASAGVTDRDLACPQFRRN